MPFLSDFTWEIWRPKDLWTEQQSEQIKTPLLTDAQVGLEAPQSAHTDSGWRGLGFEENIACQIIWKNMKNHQNLKKENKVNMQIRY